MNITENKMQAVYNAIPIGKDCAIHQAELAENLGTDTNTLKRIINKLRMEHADILSGQVGYWRSDNPEEQAAFCRMQQRQALSRFMSIKLTNAAIRDYTAGQIDLNV